MTTNPIFKQGTYGNTCSNTGAALFTTFIWAEEGYEHHKPGYAIAWTDADIRKGSDLEVTDISGVIGVIACPVISSLPVTNDDRRDFTVVEMEQALIGWYQNHINTSDAST